VVHIVQFNGKQEGKRVNVDLTCAAPATVSGRISRFRPHHSHWVPWTSAWEGDEGCSTSPDTGQ